MAFEWDVFFSQHKIDYKSEKNDLYIHCPFCGNADQGKHMGVSVRGSGWGCWRDQTHRGKNPQRLVQRLLGCSWDEAARLVGRRPGGTLGLSDDAMGAMLAGFQSQKAAPKSKLKYLPDFRPLTDLKLFVEYMHRERGFTDEQTHWLTGRFNLMCALMGDFAYRVIFPIKNNNMELVTWTGRAVGESRQRYKTLSTTPTTRLPAALAPITDHLFDQPLLANGAEFLVVTEGPFDALKLAYPIRHYNGRATCLFGKVMSDAQLDLLAELKENYKTVFMMLDPEARADTLKLSSQAASVGVIPSFLPGKKDPGDLSSNEVRRVLDALYAASAKGIMSFANSGRLL